LKTHFERLFGVGSPWRGRPLDKSGDLSFLHFGGKIEMPFLGWREKHVREKNRNSVFDLLVEHQFSYHFGERFVGGNWD
jgi:hypothetical protein